MVRTRLYTSSWMIIDLGMLYGAILIIPPIPFGTMIIISPQTCHCGLTFQPISVIRRISIGQDLLEHTGNCVVTMSFQLQVGVMPILSSIAMRACPKTVLLRSVEWDITIVVLQKACGIMPFKNWKDRNIQL